MSARVTRQFRVVQDIPASGVEFTPDELKLHLSLLRTGKVNKDWRAHNESFILVWENRHALPVFRVNCELMSHGQTSTSEYCKWYKERTIKFVQNPSDSSDNLGFQGSSERLRMLSDQVYDSHLEAHSIADECREVFLSGSSRMKKLAANLLCALKLAHIQEPAMLPTRTITDSPLPSSRRRVGQKHRAPGLDGPRLGGGRHSRRRIPHLDAHPAPQPDAHPALQPPNHLAPHPPAHPFLHPFAHSPPHSGYPHTPPPQLSIGTSFIVGSTQFDPYLVTQHDIIFGDQHHTFTRTHQYFGVKTLHSIPTSQPSLPGDAFINIGERPPSFTLDHPKGPFRDRDSSGTETEQGSGDDDDASDDDDDDDDDDDAGDDDDATDDDDDDDDDEDDDAGEDDDGDGEDAGDDDDGDGDRASDDAKEDVDMSGPTVDPDDDVHMAGPRGDLDKPVAQRKEKTNPAVPYRYERNNPNSSWTAGSAQ